MAFISKETINIVHSTADIISLVGEYTRLEKRTGNDWWGCCPFHNEKTPSFHVDGDKKFYYCFSCHASGDAIKFIMEMEKVPYTTAVESLAKRNNIPIKYDDSGYHHDNTEQESISKKIEQYIELYERTASMFHYFLTEHESGKNALDYIIKRGVDIDTIKKFKIGYSPADRFWLKKFLKSKNFSEDFLNDSGLFSKKNKDCSFFSDRLMFPIFNEKGQVVAFGGRILHPQGPDDRKYLNSGELIQYKKREVLYAFNFAKKSIRENKKIIICEGYMDCIAYHMSGIDYAVATLGTALTEAQTNLIARFAENVYLSFDSDKAGQEATWKNMLICRRKNLSVRIIRLKGGKDPSEILLNLGKENLTAQVNSAILDSDYLLSKLGAKYPVETAEGKTRAALEFFQYVDALQFDIQKESSLEQLCQAFNLRPEAVKRDFNNRVQAAERLNIRKEDNQNKKMTHIKLNAELRGLIAVIADLKQFEKICSQFTESDFKDSYARELFTILNNCYREGNFEISVVLDRCSDSNLSSLIAETLSSGVYPKEEIDAVITDTIMYIKRNKLDDQRNKLLMQIKDYVIVTEDDKKQLNSLLEQKLELDKQVQQMS